MSDADPRTVELGGCRQMLLEDHLDLARLANLDPARWAATSAPASDLHLDDALVAALTGEAQKRIRVSHLLEAFAWLDARLRDLSGLDARSSTLTLAHLDDDTELGRDLRQAAVQALDELGAEDRDALSLEQVAEVRARFARTLANGDGIVAPAHIADPEVAAFAARVAATVGTRTDASGAPGVSAAELAAFRAGAEKLVAWRAQRKADPALSPFGDRTKALFQVVQRLAPALDEWFLRADLVAQEGPAADGRTLTAEQLAEVPRWDPARVRQHLAEAPLAPHRADGRLPLDAPFNPAWRGPMATLLEEVLPEVLGPEVAALDREGWAAVRARFAAYERWVAARPAAAFDEIPDELLEPDALAAASAQLEEYLARDRAAEAVLVSLAELETLVRLQAGLLDLARNLANFADLYDRERLALFQMGTLVLDGRRLDLTVRVAERAAHRKVASESGAFLVYAQVLDRDGKAKMEVAAPVTAGERGRLRVGKRGLFLDRDGAEWDAVVVDLVENPISVREAMRAPFQRLATFVRDRFQALAATQLASAEQAASLALPAAAGSGAPAAPAPAAPPPAPAPGSEPTAPAQGSSIQSLMVMASLATAALGSAAAFVLRVLSEVDPLRLGGSLAGIAALIALCSGVLGWMRLRRRDLSLLLEANGWAVNMSMRLDRSLGATFTSTPPLPGDPPRRGWGRWLLALALVLAFVLAWNEGRLRLRRWLAARRAQPGQAATVSPNAPAPLGPGGVPGPGASAAP